MALILVDLTNIVELPNVLGIFHRPKYVSVVQYFRFVEDKRQQKTKEDLNKPQRQQDTPEEVTSVTSVTSYK